MKSYYWDTSAAVNAVVSPKVWSRLATDSHLTHQHLFAEFFAIMTGRGITVMDAAGVPTRLRLSPHDAAVWLKDFNGHLESVELDAADTVSALGDAQRKGIQGGRVHDYLHCVAAEKAKADIILTRNTADFQPLSSIPTEWP